jgi:DNA helicase II / ATP-dependent DNA helicase PcrA
MVRALTPEEQRCVAEVQALAQEFAGEQDPFAARLRVRTAAGERELLLGGRARPGATATVIDWQTAPIAAVYFGHQEGDEYELEHDGRELVGTVLRRHGVEFRGGAPVALRWPGRAVMRGPEGWFAQDLAPQLRPRPAAQRARPLSPARVELDPVQRAAVLLPASRSLLVLGEAGFGKTTVALHRLAHLARAAQQGRRRFRALVIVPTPGLRRLAARLLAELEVTGVTVETFESWVARQAERVFPALPRRLSESASPAVSRLKRHPALRGVFAKIAAGTPAMRELRAGYRDRPETVRELLLHLFGDRELLAEVVAAAGLPASTIAEVVAHTRLQFSATTEQAMAHVDRDRLRTLDGRRIDAGTPQGDAGSIDVEDYAVVFALHRASTGTDATRHGALSQYQHVLLDEAQELAPIELELLGRAVAAGGTLTVAGDGAQQVDESTRFAGWPALLAELGAQAAATVNLAVSYRCPKEIEALARAVRGAVDAEQDSEVVREGESRADAVREEDREVESGREVVREVESGREVVREVESGREVVREVESASDASVAFTRHVGACALVTALGDELLALQAQDPGICAAIVCRYPETARRLHAQLVRAVPVRLVLDGGFSFTPGIDVTCVREVKGLEFDVVIVPDADAANYPDTPAARRALYVALTRPLHRLWLAGTGRVSPLLPAGLTG